MTSRFPPFAFVELVSRIVFVVYNKNMASRFASISDEEVKEFTEKLGNENVPYFIMKSSWRSKHQSRLSPLLQMLYVN